MNSWFQAFAFLYNLYRYDKEKKSKKSKSAKKSKKDSKDKKQSSGGGGRISAAGQRTLNFVDPHTLKAAGFTNPHLLVSTKCAFRMQLVPLQRGEWEEDKDEGGEERGGAMHVRIKLTHNP